MRAGDAAAAATRTLPSQSLGFDPEQASGVGYAIDILGPPGTLP